MANAEAWLREYGKVATIGYERVTTEFNGTLGYRVVLVYYRANPARLVLPHKFECEISAQQYVAMLKQQYQPKPAPKRTRKI